MQIILLEVDPVMPLALQRSAAMTDEPAPSESAAGRDRDLVAAISDAPVSRDEILSLSSACEPSAGDSTPRPWKAAEDPRFAMAVYRVTLAHGTVDPIEDGWD